jgi:hypothetical protein
MHHSKLARVLACAALIVSAGCSDQTESLENLGEAQSALLNTDQFLYFTCNATGWNPIEANRLKSTSDPAVFSLAFQVTQPWQVNSPDQCAFLLTNRLNGYGTSQTHYSDSHPSTPVNVPAGDRLVLSSSNFPVKYPSVATYNLSVNWTQKTFTISTSLTAQQRLDACTRDPRVTSGLVSAEICAGADIFFRETFGGNGRTCGSCHPQENNTTLDASFIAALKQRNPNDPLFVADNDPNLSQLETSDLLNFAAVLENVDGFANPSQRFVSRTVSHLLSLKTSITRDPGDGTPSPPLERAGWGGDGVGDGSLSAFLEGAIKQHFTKDLRRRANVDFRLPTAQEADFTRAFQLSLGRLNELNLSQVGILDTRAEQGRLAFMDPQRGRCNVCHSNAGSNFQDTGLNRNFDNGIRFASNANFITRGREDGVLLADAGFGGQDLAHPNFDTAETGVIDGFGNGTFSPPPLIEAADTAPFFHNAFRFQSRLPDDIEEAVNFYRLPSDAFGQSQGGKLLEQRFGTRLVLTGEDSGAIARFLRVLNAALNIDIAKQRLQAASILVGAFGDTRADIQKRLMELSVVELDDALEVMLAEGNEIYPAVRVLLSQAKDEVALGLNAASSSQRQTRVSNALGRITNGRGQFGSGIDFQLGQGNLMF